MERLTRPGVHVDDSAARYIGNETRIQDVGDRLLEVILNGPTLMAFNKDRLRHMMRQLYARLEQYENTGVTPEEIAHIKTGIERVWKLLQDIDEEKLKHIEELVDAENEGRMQILPFKPGETVYTNLAMSGWYLKQKDRPYPAKVVFVGLNGEDSMGGGIFNVVYEKSAHMMQFQFSEIGKTVFLTREEAERA